MWRPSIAPVDITYVCVQSSNQFTFLVYKTRQGSQLTIHGKTTRTAGLAPSCITGPLQQLLGCSIVKCLEQVALSVCCFPVIVCCLP